jgi:hypothetical protein
MGIVAYLAIPPTHSFVTIKTMKLNQYPQAILESSKTLLKAERTAKAAKVKLDEMIGQIEADIAFDVEMKNDAQRKARRLELTQQPDYRALVDLHRAEAERFEDLQVDHAFLERCFSVAKLEARQAIATTEYSQAIAA